MCQVTFSRASGPPCSDLLMRVRDAAGTEIAVPVETQRGAQREREREEESEVAIRRVLHFILFFPPSPCKFHLSHETAEEAFAILYSTFHS